MCKMKNVIIRIISPLRHLLHHELHILFVKFFFQHAFIKYMHTNDFLLLLKHGPPYVLESLIVIEIYLKQIFDKQPQTSHLNI
jgi:hypothetical protein